MELQELLELLEIDEPQEFEYFENFADLIETDEDISSETMFELFSQTDAEAVTEIIGNYFDDALKAVPNSGTDIYTLLENIKRELTGLMRAADEDTAMAQFCDELFKFKNWYCFESSVECTEKESGEVKVLSLRDALTLSRIEKLEAEEYEYDFDGCMDYELDEYAMTFSEIYEDDQSEDSENLLDNGYVYDDEMKNED